MLFWQTHAAFFALVPKIWVFLVGIFGALFKFSFWQKLPMIVWPWFKKAVFKFFFIQLPTLILTPFLMVGLLEPQHRRRITRAMREAKRRAMLTLGAVRRRFDDFFGVNGLLALIFSIFALFIIAGLSLLTFGYELWLWVGGFGPLTPVFAATGRWIRWFFHGLIHRIPGHKKLVVLAGGLWGRLVAPLVPRVDAGRRKLRWSMLRRARRQRRLVGRHLARRLGGGAAVPVVAADPVAGADAKGDGEMANGQAGASNAVPVAELPNAGAESDAPAQRSAEACEKSAANNDAATGTNGREPHAKEPEPEDLDPPWPGRRPIPVQRPEAAEDYGIGMGRFDMPGIAARRPPTGY